MKLLSAAFILMLTSVSGVALAGDSPPVGASYSGNQVLTANSDKEKSEDKSAGSIHCACAVPMHFA